jgi:capsular exopolysaccharide synthesis family protein
MAPLIITLARIWMNDKILSKEDLENESNIPIVGMVGNSENFGNLVTHNNPRGAVTEDFRSIKLNLPYLQTRKDIQVLCVTSSVPGEGKTFCSVNLASVYAMSGKRTLVLFADLRRPRIDKELEVNTDAGLSNVLIGKSVLADVIQESSVKNLYVLTSGPTPPNPAELLGDRKMDEVMEELKKTFDCIIIDTPPLGLVADSLLMLKYCDVTCYIVRHNYTRKLFLRKINEMFEEKRIQNICLIINDIAGDTVGYGYGYGYRYGGYGYHHYGYFEDEGTTIWKKLIKAIPGRFFKK